MGIASFGDFSVSFETMERQSLAFLTFFFEQVDVKSGVSQNSDGFFGASC